MYHGTVLISMVNLDSVNVDTEVLPTGEGLSCAVSEMTLDAFLTQADDALSRLHEADSADACIQALSGLPTLAVVRAQSDADVQALITLAQRFEDARGVLARDEMRFGSPSFQPCSPSPLYETQMMLVADRAVFAHFGMELDAFTDVIAAPAASDELRFHLVKWLRRFHTQTEDWQTRQFLEATINSTPSLVWYKTADGVHEKVNNSFCDIVGKTKDDVQGRRHAYIWDVEHDDPACIESENKVMESRSTCVSEETVQSGNDTKLLTTYKSPLYDLDGSVMGTVGVAIDVTQERTYEEDLLQKNETLESMFTAMEAGVLTHSLDGTRILGINQAALNLLDYESADAMLADGFDMFAPSIVPEDAEKMRAKLATLKNVGDSISTEYRLRHDDDNIVHIIGNIKLIERDGELLYQRFMVDNSERKHEEQERERHQRELVEALSEDYTAVFVMDVNTGLGEVLRLSDDLEDRLGEVMGSMPAVERVFSDYIEKLVSDDDKHALRHTLLPVAVREQLEGRERYHVLYRAMAKRMPDGASDDGAFEYRQVTVAQAGAWTGDARNVVIGFRNVDAETREEMQQKELLEAALAQARRASEAKSTFLTNMSHDIRTPMNAIIGFTTLANNHMSDVDAVATYLNKIHASSTHLLSLINDILDMSRIEAGSISIDEQPCTMEGMLENLIDIIEPEAEASGLALSLETRGDMGAPIMADKLKINQIMLNLLGNSVKFTPEGGSVRMESERLTGGDDELVRYRLTVQDTGIGMTQEFLAHIFDPFERENTSTISGIQGTGLGMAITKSLVDMMGGTIEVESEKGAGTTFRVELAFKRACDIDAESLEGTSIASISQSAHLKGYRVLLVDDNMLNREIAMTLLEDAGFVVDTAVDGQDAVNRIAEAPTGRYQLILMDIQMPVMNGYEAARCIRAMDDAEKAAIPILAVTADAFEEDRKRALDAGMDGHLAKPIEVPDLFDALEKLLCL